MKNENLLIRKYKDRINDLENEINRLKEEVFNFIQNNKILFSSQKDSNNVKMEEFNKIKEEIKNLKIENSQLNRDKTNVLS